MGYLYDQCLLCQQEIDHLRLQLEEARKRLRLAEQAQQPHTPPLIDLDMAFPSEAPSLPYTHPSGASPTPPNDSKVIASTPHPACGCGRQSHVNVVCGMLQLVQQLELERSARHDLEMHATALEQQKALLHDETKALKKDLDDSELMKASSTVRRYLNIVL